MTATNTGILIGAVLALSWVAFGFWAFVFVAVAMGIGALVARIVTASVMPPIAPTPRRCSPAASGTRPRSPCPVAMSPIRPSTRSST